MCNSGAGKAHRDGINIFQLQEMFPDEASATKWFEQLTWPGGRHCPRCGCGKTTVAPEISGLPYWCPECRQAFSVRTGTALERSKVSLRRRVFAIHLEMTSLKGVSSMKLHRDIGVTQKTAWFMLHRIREAWANELIAMFTGPVEVDDTYVGRKRKYLSSAKRRQLKEDGAGHGAVGKAAVVGIKDRRTNKASATAVQSTGKPTLQGFIRENVEAGVTIVRR